MDFPQLFSQVGSEDAALFDIFFLPRCTQVLEQLIDQLSITCFQEGAVSEFFFHGKNNYAKIVRKFIYKNNIVY